MLSAMGPRTNERFLPFITFPQSLPSSSISELETASILCLAEIERDKGGGVIVNRPEERICFIAKMGYPLPVFPWKNKILIFDGLNQNSHSLSYAYTSNGNAFADLLLRASKSEETYSDFLNENESTTKELERKALIFPGLVTDKAFLVEIDTYLQEASKNDFLDVKIGLLPQRIDDATINSEIRELENLQNSFRTNMETFSKSLKWLSKTTLEYVAELRARIRNVTDEYDRRIEGDEKNVAPKIAQLRDEYDFRINSMTKTYQKELLPIQQEKKKTEKYAETALAKLDHVKQEAKIHADKKRAAAERKCRERIKKLKQEISNSEKRLKEIEKTLKSVEEKRMLESMKLKEELDSGIMAAKKTMIELEATRDAKVLILDQEIEKLEKQTKAVSNKINVTLKTIESDIEALSTLGVKREPKPEAGMLHYVPFYIVCFEAESKKRYLIVTPSTMKNISVSIKIKRALGRPLIKNLLTPRFRTIRSILEIVAILASQNVGFENTINDLGARNNILEDPGLREKMSHGLVSLKNEGWLSINEFSVLNKMTT